MKIIGTMTVMVSQLLGMHKKILVSHTFSTEEGV